jgi:hypothetical protein
MTQAGELLLSKMNGGQVADELAARMGWSTERRPKLTFLESTPAGKMILKPGRWSREDVILWIDAELEGDEKTRAVDTMLLMKTAPAPAPAPAIAAAPTSILIYHDAS